MQEQTNIRGTVDFHILSMALEKLAGQVEIPQSIVDRVHQLNAKKCEVSPDNV